jgi:hypothetical protein
MSGAFHGDILRGRKPAGRIYTYPEGLSPNSLPLVLRNYTSFPHTGNNSLKELGDHIENGLRAACPIRPRSTNRD